MGTLKASFIAEQLQQHGRDSNTPVAIISQGTQLTQTTLVGRLKNLAELAKNAPTPALIVVGEVVELHHKLAWFGEDKQRQKRPHFTLDSLAIRQVA